MPYLESIVHHARATNDAIIECGSGLTSILLAIVAQRFGKKVRTLEHLPIFADRLRVALEEAGLAGALQLDNAPLKSFGAFDWYDAVANGETYGLVVCDGPPGSTFGSRYGLMPVVGAHLRPGATILLDDVERPDAQRALARWVSEFGVTYTLAGGVARPFAVIKTPLVSVGTRA